MHVEFFSLLLLASVYQFTDMKTMHCIGLLMGMF